MTISAVRHTTTYRYARPVKFNEHRMMFRPRDSFDQRLLESDLSVSPEPRDIRWIHDVFGNCITLVRLDAAATELRFESSIRLDHRPQAAPTFSMNAKALTYPFEYDPEEAPDLAVLVRRQHGENNDEVGRWARQFLKPAGKTNTGTMLMTMCCAIQEGFVYSRRTAPGTQPPATTLLTKRGTCRDFALLMMEAVRSLGLAARFVSGYLYVPSRDGPAKRGGGSTHAWCQVYLPGAGWVEFDPTNGIVGNKDLIRVAVARDPHQAIPLSGSYRGAAADYVDMVVQVNVTTESSEFGHPDAGAPVRSEPQTQIHSLAS